jgi:hypothetical protein
VSSIFTYLIVCTNPTSNDQITMRTPNSHNPIPSLLCYTLYKYIPLYLFTQGGGLVSLWLFGPCPHLIYVRLQSHFILLQQPIYGVSRWASGHATPRFLICQTPDYLQQLHYLEHVSSFKLKHVIFPCHDRTGSSKVSFFLSIF